MLLVGFVVVLSACVLLDVVLFCFLLCLGFFLFVFWVFLSMQWNFVLLALQLFLWFADVNATLSANNTN